MKKALVFLGGGAAVAVVALVSTASGRESEASLVRKMRAGDVSAANELYSRRLWRETQTRRRREKDAARSEGLFGTSRELA